MLLLPPKPCALMKKSESMFPGDFHLAATHEFPLADLRLEA